MDIEEQYDKWDDNKGALEDFYLQHIDEEGAT